MTKLHITSNHTGKMYLIQSLSTSATVNPYCKARAKDNTSVCTKCYAQKMLKRYGNLEKALINNSDILTSTILPENELPRLNCIYFRFEAFGDLINDIQVINYLNICKVNKQTKFALWTKNPLIFASGLKKFGKKPSNLQVILSSNNLNETIENTFSFVDKVFTVYDKQTIENNNIKINCGSRDCFGCHICYTKNKVTQINEKLK